MKLSALPSSAVPTCSTLAYLGLPGARGTRFASRKTWLAQRLSLNGDGLLEDAERLVLLAVGFE